MRKPQRKLTINLIKTNSLDFSKDRVSIPVHIDNTIKNNKKDIEISPIKELKVMKYWRDN